MFVDDIIEPVASVASSGHHLPRLFCQVGRRHNRVGKVSLVVTVALFSYVFLWLHTVVVTPGSVRLVPSVSVATRPGVQRLGIIYKSHHSDLGLVCVTQT